MGESLKKTYVFAEMPVHRAVLSQIAPAVISQMIWLVYNLADTYFVGLLNDPIQTAAVTVAGSVFILLTAISNLFGVGGASAISASLGERNYRKANRISSLCFWGCLICGIAFALIIFALAKPIFTLCGATEETYAATFSYARWTLMLGAPSTIMSMMLGNLVRSEGSANYASFGLSMGAVLNIILDPFFILPNFLGFGAEGAGIATALSNFIAMLFFLAYLLFRRKTTVLHISPRLLPESMKDLSRVLSIGFPAALQGALTLVSVAAALNFISKYTTAAVAAYGIVQRISYIPLYFTMGISNGLLPLLAYNHAAKNNKRRSSCFRFGLEISVGFAIICLICCELFPVQLTSLFINDAETIGYASQFLRLMSIAMPLMAACYPMIVQFQAMGKPVESLISSIIRKGTLDIPILFIMDSVMPLYGIVLVWPIVDTISLIVILLLYRHVQNSLKKSEA